MKLLLLLTALFAATSAFADLPDAPHFFWTPPTAYTNGVVLDPLTDLKNYNLSCTGAAVVTKTIAAPAVDWQAPVGLFVPGDYTCSMTVVDKASLESAASTSANFTQPVALPMGVTTFTIQ